MDSVVELGTQPNVSPADNRRKLEQIDADVSGILKSMIRSEEADRSGSAKIISAGVQMLEIQHNDPAAWEAFKNADPQAKEIACKGKDWEAREVASVLWRRHRASYPSRERISLYGKAIRVARDAYCADGKVNVEELLTHIVNAGGVKGILRIARTAKGNSCRKKVILDIPPTLTLFLVGPDGTREPLEPALNRRFLIELGRLQ
ncbi:MAG: hypothetical protein Q8M19_15845 [Reyranella sp.]|uniref:hypothetical protein n=1 Tax=Reyranella sp. TaxID=1929291 RepID=UPI001226091C|nr:hypothetical protein [Reyranella sp.]MDP2332159.1 hypothetical protein [Reyranella sp.]TAJ41401.1 MAG: hypothetical protein EPO55_05560 [Reyranella sp.]